MRIKKSGISFLCFLALGCQRNHDSLTGPTSPSDDIYAVSRIVKPKNSVRIWLNDPEIRNTDHSCIWSANIGAIEGTQDTATYYAPDTSGIASIRVRIVKGSHRYVDGIDLVIASQIVILKADDFTCGSSHAVSDNWETFINVIHMKKLKACLGIIGQSLERENDGYLQLIRDLGHTGQFEFWNHGYDHVLYGVNSKGEMYHEFVNTSLEDQKSHILLTQRLAEQKAGVVLTTFGAPGNVYDDNTIKALHEVREIKIWFFGSGKSDKMILSRRSEIEFPAHYPDFYEFRKTYDSTQVYQVFQIHPDSWDNDRFNEFGKIADFLISRKVIFFTTQDYFRFIPSP
jgi:hypothetical protein